MFILKKKSQSAVHILQIRCLPCTVLVHLSYHGWIMTPVGHFLPISIRLTAACGPRTMDHGPYNSVSPKRLRATMPHAERLDIDSCSSPFLFDFVAHVRANIDLPAGTHSAIRWLLYPHIHHTAPCEPHHTYSPSPPSSQTSQQGPETKVLCAIS